MTDINWDKVKFRASSWGNLLADPQLKEDKLAGKLGVSCQRELLTIYNQVVYDWNEEDITTRAMEKGTKVQTASMEMLQRVEGIFFTENAENLENEWFTGTPDIFVGDEIRKATRVDDLKNSELLCHFTDKTIDKATNTQIAQLNVYYSLTGASEGNITHALMSLPSDMFEKEKDKLLWRMTNNGEVATEYAPEYLYEVAKLEKKFIYDHIPEEERIWKIPVPKDEELIQKMKDKVPRLREWLHHYHNSRKSNLKFV